MRVCLFTTEDMENDDLNPCGFGLSRTSMLNVTGCGIPCPRRWVGKTRPNLQGFSRTTMPIEGCVVLPDHVVGLKPDPLFVVFLCVLCASVAKERF